MMYTDKVVACIKVNGQVLRENGDTVALPFGCEYSILVKNLNSVRLQLTVAVDGSDAAGQLVIAPNSSLELERFIRNGNLDAGNRFKFIERTPEIEQHRGIGADDGLIRIEAWKERVRQFVDVPIPRYYDVPYPVPRPYYPTRPPMHPRWRGSGGMRDSARPTMDCALDSGITVPGSASRQRFVSVMGFDLEPQSIVIVLRLRGQIEGVQVPEPVTVDQKPECSTCGKMNSATSRFCARCGTALEII